MRLFDSAQAYGAGHSEVVLGKALTSHPDVTVVSKFGWAIDTQAKTLGDMVTDPAMLLMHPNDMDIATPICDELDRMPAEGAIGG